MSQARSDIEIMFRLLRYEVCGGEALPEDCRRYAAENLEGLYLLSKSHDIAHLVGDALAKQGLLGDDDVSKKFEKQLMLAIFRCEQMNFELESICAAFEDAQIRFVPLKGSVIRRYYPEPWMRTSCDIDILIDRADHDRGIAVLKERLSYELEKHSTHDSSLYSPGGIHLELHYDLVEEGNAADASRVLVDAISKAIPMEGCRYMSEFDDATFYFYHIAHMAKHIEYGGCGVRPLIDEWVLDRKLEYDPVARDALLESGGLLTFAKHARELCNVWFSGAEASDDVFELQYYILNGGVYGAWEQKIEIQRAKKGGGFRYALSRIFMSYELLKYRYPILKKHKWLTPFYEIRRWFALIFGGRAKYSLEELSVNRGVTRTREEQTRAFLDRLGL